jgi:ATP-dependent helicase/DNAse subunit B
LSETGRKLAAVTRHRLTAGPFSALASRLFDAIGELQRGDALARVDVLVGSNLLGLDLRRRLADTIAEQGPRRGHANVRFLTFLDLARELAGPGQGRAATPALLFATIAASIPRVPESARFGEVRHRVGFAACVEATLRDLLDAGITAEEFSGWAEDLADTDRRKPLTALSAIYRDVTSHLTGFAHEAAVFREAARNAGETTSPLLVYGFYDFTGLQRDLLAALATGRPLQVFLPRYQGDLGDFSRRTEDFLSSLLGCAARTIEGPKSSCSRERFVGQFGRRVTGRPLAEDGTLALVSAADDSSEAREVAREILMARETGLALPRTAVLLRQEGDGPRFEAALARAGIPCFRRPAETWAQTPVGRALALWLRLEEEGFRRDDVLDVLELARPEGPDPQASHFRGLARQAGVVRGAAAWDAAVKRVLAAASEGSPEDETRGHLATRLPGGPEAARCLGARWSALKDSAEGWPEGPLPFSAWADEARRRLRLLFSPEELPEPAGAALDGLAALPDDVGQVSREAAFEVLLSGLSARAAGAGRLGKDGVAILTVMEARGLIFDHVLLPGLVERSFPARARPDPLLFDEERASLARRTGRPIAPRTLERPAEERLLFAIAADAAAKRLTLLASRRNSALDRERTPSQLFTRAKDAAGFERRTLLGAVSDYGPPVSLSEARRRALESDGASALAEVFPPLAAALKRRSELARPSFGPYEGRLSSPDLAEALATHVPGPGRPVSASALERFCRCSYQYFFRHVLGLKAVEDSEETADLTPLELGALFHDAARRVALGRRGRPFGELSDDRALRRLAASCAAQALDAFEQESGAAISPALLKEIAFERLRDHVEAWLRFERREPRGGFAPEGAEVRFGPPSGRDGESDPSLSTEEPALSAAGVPLRGQIDCVSSDPRLEQIRVTDFKVKLSPKVVRDLAKARVEGAALWGGEMLQLPVYTLAAEGPLRQEGAAPRSIASEYLLLAADPSLDEPSVRVESAAFDAAATRAAVGTLDEILEKISASIAAGVFRPRPSGRLRQDQCSLCDFDAICGPGHERLFARKAEHRDDAVRRLDSLQVIP